MSDRRRDFPITSDMVSLWIPSGNNRAIDLIRGNHGQCYGTHPNVPVISKPGGAELVTDSGLNIWTDASNLTHWAKSESGSSTVNREATEKIEGDYSCRLDVDASDSKVWVRATVTLVSGIRNKVVLWYKNSVAGKTLRIQIFNTENNIYLDSNGVWQAAETHIALPNSTVWRRYTLDFYSHADYTNYNLILRNLTSASSSIYWDNVSIKEYKPAVIDPTLGWHFDRVDDYVKVADDNSLTPTSALTVAGWINSEDITAQQRIVDKFVSPNGYECTLYTSQLQAFIATTGGEIVTWVAHTQVLSSNTWYHVAMVYNGAKLKLFVNGSMEEWDCTGTIANSSSALIIGRNSALAQYEFDGYIALPFVANKAWSAEQVENFYNFTKGLFSPR